MKPEEGDTCVICKQEKAQYKCPKCSARYCTVACCKDHKTQCGVSSDLTTDDRSVANADKVEDTPGVSNSSTLIDTEIISEECKRKLRNSKWLKDILRSNRLREEITAIDKGDDRPKLLRAACESNPEFDAFVNKMLDELRQG